MNEIKVNLNVVLPGRVILSEKECSKNPEKSYNSFNMKLSLPENLKESSGKKTEEVITIHTRKTIPATQSLNLSVEAYYTMTSKKEVPHFSHLKEWNSLTVGERLRMHLGRICESLGGISYSYIVLED